MSHLFQLPENINIHLSFTLQDQADLDRATAASQFPLGSSTSDVVLLITVHIGSQHIMNSCVFLHSKCDFWGGSFSPSSSEQRALSAVMMLNGVICITSPDLDSPGAQGCVF